MIDRPKCEHCGKFISDEALSKHYSGDTSEIDSKMLYTGYPEPEPWGDVFWHVKCEEET